MTDSYMSVKERLLQAIELYELTEKCLVSHQAAFASNNNDWQMQLLGDEIFSLKEQQHMDLEEILELEALCL